MEMRINLKLNTVSVMSGNPLRLDLAKVFTTAFLDKFWRKRVTRTCEGHFMFR
jgi:hypothetical protein